MRILILLAAILSLAACGGYRKAPRDIGVKRATVVRVAPQPTAPGAATEPETETVAIVPLRVATGPISRACLASDRKARSTQRCGCIQAVANDMLSSSDQRLAVSFYADPHKAQEIRQSDNPRHEVFWKTYKDYAETASAVCSGV